LLDVSTSCAPPVTLTVSLTVGSSSWTLTRTLWLTLTSIGDQTLAALSAGTTTSLTTNGTAANLNLTSLTSGGNISATTT